MSAEGTKLVYEGCSKTQRHPLVIYTDFEELLIKIIENNTTGNATAFQKHKPIRFGFIVKATENVPIELLE